MYGSNINRDVNIIKYYWKALIASLIYDLIWYYFHQEGVFRKGFDNDNSALEGFCFFFSFLNSIAKAVLIVLVYSMIVSK